MAAGIAIIGEKAVVAMAIAVPLFLPVLVKTTAILSSYVKFNFLFIKVNKRSETKMKAMLGINNKSTTFHCAIIIVALLKKIMKTIANIEIRDREGNKGWILLNPFSPSHFVSRMRVRYPKIIGAMSTSRIDFNIYAIGNGIRKLCAKIVIQKGMANIASIKLKATITVASSMFPSESPVYPIAILEQGTTITSMNPKESAGSVKNNFTSIHPKSGAHKKLKRMESKIALRFLVALTSDSSLRFIIIG